MFRLSLGVMLVGLIAAAQAAQPDEDYFVPKLDLLTTQFAYSGSNILPAFKFGTSVVLSRQPDVLPIEPLSGSASQLSSIARLQQEFTQVPTANNQQANAIDRISLPRILGIGFKGEQVNVTVRPNSALIEGKQFKIILKPNSAFVLWGKAF